MRSLGGVFRAIPLALLVSGCVPFACAGQCSAPYELDVMFRSGTTQQVAQAVLDTCGHKPIVVRIGTAQMVRGGLLRGRLWTEDILRSSKTQPLLNCLDHSPSVIGAAWPD